MLKLIKSVQILYKSTIRALGIDYQKCFSCGSYTDKMKVSIVGGAGKIGQPLSLMLKQSPLIDELCVYDLKETEGLVAELNHIDTNCKVTGYSGKEKIGEALKDSKLIVILAAAPSKDTLNYNKQWSPNAQIVQEILYDISSKAPNAFLAIATNPINSMVPMACETLKKTGTYNPKTIFGITTLDSVRANTFASRGLGIEPENVRVPVIGGHTEDTIVPLLSNTQPSVKFANEELENITMKVKRAQDNMLRLTPAESAPLASAFACARFVISLIKAVKGYQDIVECAYVPSNAHPELKYLSTPLLLGPTGISKNLGIPLLSEYESCMLDNAINSLAEDIKKGEMFANIEDSSPLCDPCVFHVS